VSNSSCPVASILLPFLAITFTSIIDFAISGFLENTFPEIVISPLIKAEKKRKVKP
jgi:hypothetical protein